MKLIGLISTLTLLYFCAAAQETDAGKQKVRVQAIRVTGSRIGKESMMHLTGLHSGQVLDEATLRAALQNANASGLFTGISYNYESLPDSTDVNLELVVQDQLPLVPAVVKIPGVHAEDVWAYLTKTDALFTRDLPPTVNAIRLYERYINKYLQNIGRTDITVSGSVTGSQPPSNVTFEAVKLRSPGR